MTHKDIYTKFMIEYDKANVTSSYPSLTEYEVATLLDKAYLALIAQKVTGNNFRRASLESDIKSISDLSPLIVHKDIRLFTDQHQPAINIVQYKLPDDFAYFVSAALNQQLAGSPYDAVSTRLVPVELVSHKIAELFFSTPYNMPWVKNPVNYIEGDTAFVVYDPVNKPSVSSDDVAHLSYIKYPKLFVKNLIVGEVEDPGQNTGGNTPSGGQTDPEDPTDPEEDTGGVFILDQSRLNSNDLIQ